MPEKTTDKTERQSTKWETIFANDMTNKELISNIHKQLIQLNIKNHATQIKNGQKTRNRHLFKEDIQVANKHEKMQIETMRYHFTPVRMDIIKKSTNNKRWRGCGNANWYNHYRKQHGGSSKK